jgi:hypothetical protein
VSGSALERDGYGCGCATANVQSNLLFWVRASSKIVRGKPECCYNLIGKQHALCRLIYCSSGTTYFSPSQNQDASKTVLNKRDAGTRVTCNFHRPPVQRTPHTHTEPSHRPERFTLVGALTGGAYECTWPPRSPRSANHRRRRLQHLAPGPAELPVPARPGPGLLPA